MSNYHFFAMMARMKYISRWSLMRNSDSENISEHSLEVAMIAHALAVISNVRFGNDLNTERAALIGMYHDTTEIITGDMPTPVKYFNTDIKSAYKEVEDIAWQVSLSECFRLICRNIITIYFIKMKRMNTSGSL